MEFVFLNFKALSKQAAEGNPIGIMDSLLYMVVRPGDRPLRKKYRGCGFRVSV